MSPYRKVPEGLGPHRVFVDRTALTLVHPGAWARLYLLYGFPGVLDDSVKADSALCPVGAVQGAILDGFAQMLRCDVLGGFEVGDGAGHFQDTVVGTGRKA